MTSPHHLAAVNINVRDLDASIAFYEDVLELTVLLRQHSAAMMHDASGEGSVALFLRQLGPRAARTSSALGVQWLLWRFAESTEVDRAADRLKARGALGSRHEHHGIEYVSGHDPDRTKILVCCPREGSWPAGLAEIPDAVYLAE